MLEKAFTKKLREAFPKAYPRCLTDKVFQGGMTGSGRPDLTVIGSYHDKPGIVANIEVKVNKNKPKPKQYYRMQEICKAGGTGVWVRQEGDEVVWRAIDDSEICRTTGILLDGILEKCEEYVRKRRTIWDDFKINL